VQSQVVSEILYPQARTLILALLIDLTIAWAAKRTGSKKRRRE
jgi:hypothetical protein